MALPRIRLLLGLLLMVGMASSALSQEPANALVDRLTKLSKDKKAIKAKSDDAPIRKLLIERYNIALEELQIHCKEFETRLVRLDPVVESARKLFRAELALYDTAPERKKILVEAIALLKWYEGEIEKSLKDGLGNRPDYLNMRFDRLGLEIELLKEQDRREGGGPDTGKR